MHFWSMIFDGSFLCVIWSFTLENSIRVHDSISFHLTMCPTQLVFHLIMVAWNSSLLSLLFSSVLLIVFGHLVMTTDHNTFLSTCSRRPYACEAFLILKSISFFDFQFFRIILQYGCKIPLYFLNSGIVVIYNNFGERRL